MVRDLQFPFTENSAFLLSFCLFTMGYLQRSLSPCSSFSSSLDLYPFSIDSEIWRMAEERTQEILWIIQPALASDQKRKEVIDYIRTLIKVYYATEVFPFGSVPLKTYLPDGDIDLTALSHPNMEEDLAREIFNILKYKEEDPELEVKDVQYIEAQVKIVKCSVKNISVDISFNQITGLCALCFLEKVDQFIGKNHLLKHSIILIKAWCFYESRILGAHHGLISTYALEILVLHIINIFHSTLPGPLAVLYRFLEYYSTFDWDNYCVSIHGRVAISSLPEIVDSPYNSRNELLLTPEFLKSCREKFSFPIKEIENGSDEFPVKHLNILDPLKDSNNLGRSVSKGNFYRIKCALLYGAQRLGEILMQPGESMGARLEKFFTNTLDRNGRGERPDTPVLIPAFGTGRSHISDLSGDYNNYCNVLLRGQWYHNYSLPLSPWTLSPQISPPVSPSQIQQRVNWDTLSNLLRCKNSAFPQRGTDVFVPRGPPCHPYFSQLYTTTSGIDEMGKSRGTGTYIPDVSHHPYKDLLPWMKGRNPDSPTHSPFNLPQKAEEVENDRERETSKNCCHDLSLDQFPLLPYHKKYMRPIFKSLQAKEHSASFVIEGTFGHPPSPLSLPLSMARKEAESRVPFTLKTMPTSPKISAMMQQE